MFEIGITMKRVKVFIKKLQRANDERKRRWYIGTAVLLMAFILATWGWYISSFVIKKDSTEATQNDASSLETETGFLKTLQRGWSSISSDMVERFQNPKNSFGGAIGGIAEKANETRDILIEAPESNFYFEGIEELSTSTLPIAPKKSR